MKGRSWSEGIEVTTAGSSDKKSELIYTRDRFFEILTDVHSKKRGRKQAWLEACLFTGVCPKSISLRMDVLNAVEMFNYCASGLSIVLPYPEEGYGGQAATWFDVVQIMSEARFGSDDYGSGSTGVSGSRRGTDRAGMEERGGRTETR